MRWLFIILFAISCTSFKHVGNDEIEKRWSILELAINEKWTKKDIFHILGNPESRKPDEEGESWFYDSKENDYQEWVISFNLKGEIVTNIGFGPTGSMGKEFTLPKILERWKNLNCKKKKSKWYSKGHTVYQDIYYICDGGKRIDYNRYNEVSWIRVH